MTNRIGQVGGVVFLLFLVAITPVRGAERQMLHGHVPAPVARLLSSGRLAASQHLNLSIGLPVRDPAGLKAFLQQLYDPASPNFHHYLTPEQFTARFGPSEQDYQAVAGFASSHGLKVTGTHSDRMLLDVEGAVSNIETTLQVNLRLYPHPTEGRTFFAPDREPSLDLDVPVLHVAGLDNYVLPRPLWHKKEQKTKPASGSAPIGGSYMGSDFRNAYAPGVSQTGAGQIVGLLEFDGYVLSDVTNYEGIAHLTPITVTNVYLNNFNGNPVVTEDAVEVCLDIEMVASMAPGVAAVIVYEGTNTADDILSRIASDNQAKQISASWTYPIDAASDQYYQKMAAQGQTFFNAAGDYDAYSSSNPVALPTDDPYVISVGGTTLTMNGAGVSYLSETVWNRNNGIGTGGGISTTYPIPTWQQGLNMTTNQGSTTMRNLPDVAMTAEDVYVYANGTGQEVGGTSCATPLWAGFMALANQQSAAYGAPTVGFFNPIVYAIGQSTNYSAAFHDIKTGNNFSTNSLSLFSACAGYDLCTGWGTPTGSNTIAALVPAPDPLRIFPTVGFAASGPCGGPFTNSSQTYVLSNAGVATLNWSLANTSAWLTVSPSSGTLDPGDSTTVTASTNGIDSSLLLGSYADTVWFSNLLDGVAQSRGFTLNAGNGGFETGNFAYWTFSGHSSQNYVDSIINYPNYVHSGEFTAILGQSRSVATLTQTLATTAQQSYILSFWLDNPVGGTPNQFSVSWNGTSLYNQSSLPKFGWTNMQFTVTATGSSTALQFGFRNDPDAFGLDDISLQVVPTSAPLITTQPSSQTVQCTSNATFSVIAGGTSLHYQWYLSGSGAIAAATNSSLTLTNVALATSGSYNVIVTNSMGSATSQVAVLTVNDTIAPVVTLQGSATMTVQCRASFTDPGATANDSCAGSLSVASSGSVNTNVVGSYLLSYAATDPSGNSATNTRLVHVVDTTPPVVTLTGSGTLSVECHSSFADPGATASDTCAGSLPVTTKGTVNTNTIGSYLVSYVATDPSGNSATNTRLVNVVDTTAPIVTLNGPATTNVECNASFTDPGATASDTCAGSLAVTTVGTNSVNSTGSFTLTYIATDPSGNSATNTRLVNVVDTTPPVITLNGPATTNVECNSAFADPGATASDSCAGSLSVSSIGTVNTNVVGSYLLSYVAADPSGNSATNTLLVNVVDTTAPVVTLNGPATTNVECSASFTDPGATASDSCAGSLPVTSSGFVNTNVRGSYLLSYIATDPSGNSATNTLLVNVVDTTPPVITLIGAATTNVVQYSSFADPGATADDSCDGLLPVTSSGSVDVTTVGTYLLSYTAEDSSGNSAVSIRTVSVTPAPAPLPVITNQPSSLTNNAGTTAIFTVGVFGYDLSYQWSVGSAPLTDGGNISGSSSASLTISNVLGANGGSYSLTVTNSGGGTNSNIATLTVIDPVIDTQPVSASVLLGQGASLTAGAAGTLPLSWQWTLQGTNLAGATDSSIVLTNVQICNAGSYQVVASNTFGMATSSVATLSILGVPVRFLTNAPSLLYTNGQLVLSLVNLTGQGPVEIDASPDFQTWIPIYTNPPAFGQIQFIDTAASNFPTRYYRAITPAP